MHGRFLMYIHNYTYIYTRTYIKRMCVRIHSVAGRRTSEGDFTYSSVAVDRDGSKLEHRGDKDFPWHLGCRPTGWNCVESSYL